MWTVIFATLAFLTTVYQLVSNRIFQWKAAVVVAAFLVYFGLSLNPYEMYSDHVGGVALQLIACNTNAQAEITEYAESVARSGYRASHQELRAGENLMACIHNVDPYGGLGKGLDEVEMAYDRAFNAGR